MPTDDLLSLIFETLLEEGAVKQIKECAWLLRGLFDASADQRRTQRVVLKGVTTLVTKKGQGEGMLKKTPAILMVLYDLDLLEEEEVVKWHTHAPGERDEAGRKVREAADPFIKWLREAEEGSGEEDRQPLGLGLGLGLANPNRNQVRERPHDRHTLPLPLPLP